jgi:hypothetical protein
MQTLSPAKFLNSVLQPIHTMRAMRGPRPERVTGRVAASARADRASRGQPRRRRERVAVESTVAALGWGTSRLTSVAGLSSRRPS